MRLAFYLLVAVLTLGGCNRTEPETTSSKVEVKDKILGGQKIEQTEVKDRPDGTEVKKTETDLNPDGTVKKKKTTVDREQTK